MGWQIRPARADDLPTVADDLAAIIWELRKRLARTEHIFLVDEVCAEFDIEIKDVAA
jgi:hypothetical protein